MNSQDIQNLQESYLAVYDDETRENLEFENWVNNLLDEGYDLSSYTWDEMAKIYIDEARAEGVKEYQPRNRNPLPKEKPLSGEKGDGSGYGADKKFTQDTDAKSFKPGVDVPKVKQFGRISRIIPHGIGDHANKTQSRVSTIVRKDPGAPTSQKLPPQEKKKNLEIVRKTKNEEFQNWVNNLLDEGYDLSGYTWEGLYEEYIQTEAYNLYDVILSHLLDEGYAETVENAEAIMVNMSEEWRESIVYDQQLDEISIGMKRRAADASVDKVKNAGARVRSATNATVEPYLRNQQDKAEKQHLRLANAAKDVK
jgi:hypothetical protein